MPREGREGNVGDICGLLNFNIFEFEDLPVTDQRPDIHQTSEAISNSKMLKSENSKSKTTTHPISNGRR